MTANPVPNKRSTTMQPLLRRARARRCWPAAVPRRAQSPRRRRTSRPSSITHHQFAVGGAERRLHRDRRDPAAQQRQGRAAGRHLLRRLHARRRRSRPPADHLRVQRRPGRQLGLSASRRARPAHRAVRAGRADARRRPPSWSTIPTTGSTSPTWCSSIRSAPATAAPVGERASATGASPRTSTRSRASSTAISPRPAGAASPKYLVGESYGGFRAARLPEVLADDHSIAIAGVFLISPVLEFSLIGGDDLALLPDVLRLPSYAAVHLEQSGTLEARRHWPRSSASRWDPTSPRSPPRRATRRRCVRSIPRWRASPACPRR